jgi:formamidopyrimidine-DNA glycosylase
VRKLGEIDLTDDLAAFIKTKGLGPDALSPSLTLPAFRNIMAGRRGKIKPLLMNHRVIAGIGNLYADEICYQCRIHPETTVDRLSRDQIASIYRTMRQVLARSVAVSADFGKLPKTWLLPGRKRGSCPRCCGNLTRIELGGRGTYFCPVCLKQ